MNTGLAPATRPASTSRRRRRRSTASTPPTASRILFDNYMSTRTNRGWVTTVPGPPRAKTSVRGQARMLRELDALHRPQRRHCRIRRPLAAGRKRALPVRHRGRQTRAGCPTNLAIVPGGDLLQRRSAPRRRLRPLRLLLEQRALHPRRRPRRPRLGLRQRHSGADGRSHLEAAGRRRHPADWDDSRGDSSDSRHVSPTAPTS